MSFVSKVFNKFLEVSPDVNQLNTMAEPDPSGSPTASLLKAAGAAHDYMKTFIEERDPFAWGPAKDTSDPEFMDGQLAGVDLQNQDVLSPTCSPSVSPVLRASMPPATPSESCSPRAPLSRPISPENRSISPGRPVSPTTGRPISPSTRDRNIGTADSQTKRRLTASSSEGSREKYFQCNAKSYR